MVLSLLCPPNRQLQTAVRPLRTLASGWTNPALSIVSYIMCPMMCCTTLVTDPLTTPACQCLSRTQHKTAETAQVVISQVLGLLATLLLVQPSTCLFSFAARAYCCFVFKLPFFKTPRYFSVKCSPASQLPACTGAGGYSITCAGLRSLSVHFSSLSRSLWVLVLPSSTSSAVPNFLSSLKFAEDAPCLFITVTKKGIWTVLSHLYQTLRDDTRFFIHFWLLHSNMGIRTLWETMSKAFVKWKYTTCTASSLTTQPVLSPQKATRVFCPY